MRILPNRLIASFIIMSLVLSGTAGAECTLDPVTLRTKEHILFGEKWVPTDVTTSFGFSTLASGKVRIDQTMTIVTPVERILDATAENLEELPNDECGQIGRYEGVGLQVEPPSLKLQVDFSAAQWACASMDLPCPTTDDLGRMCTQQAKTRIGSGSGWVKVYLTPAMMANTLSLQQRVDRNFNLDNDTKWIGGLLGSITARSPGIIMVILLGNHLEKLVENNIHVSPLTAKTEIEEIPGFPVKTHYAGFTRDIVEQECFRIGVSPTLDGVELGLGVATQEVCMKTSSVELQVERSGLAKAPMACFIRNLLLSR